MTSPHNPDNITMPFGDNETAILGRGEAEMPEDIREAAAHQVELMSVWLRDEPHKTAQAMLEISMRAERERCLSCQPSTAENPNEDAYQRGRFDGIMEFARAIAHPTLAEQGEG